MPGTTADADPHFSMKGTIYVRVTGIITKLSVDIECVKYGQPISRSIGQCTEGVSVRSVPCVTLT